MSMVSHLHHLFNPDTCQSYTIEGIQKFLALT